MVFTYKEEVHSKGSGSTKMSEDEIKKYTEAISKNSDNLFVCPRCRVHTDKLKANIKSGCYQLEMVHLLSNSNGLNPHSLLGVPCMLLLGNQKIVESV